MAGLELTARDAEAAALIETRGATSQVTNVRTTEIASVSRTFLFPLARQTNKPDI
jgi:hypothetical protein